MSCWLHRARTFSLYWGGVQLRNSASNAEVRLHGPETDDLPSPGWWTSPASSGRLQVPLQNECPPQEGLVLPRRWGEKLGVELLLHLAERSQLRCRGHLLQMPPGRLPREVFQTCPTRRSPQGRPRKHWRDCVSQRACVWERQIWVSLLRLLFSSWIRGRRKTSGKLEAAGFLRLNLYTCFVFHLA